MVSVFSLLLISTKQYQFKESDHAETTTQHTTPEHHKTKDPIPKHETNINMGRIGVTHRNGQGQMSPGSKTGLRELWKTHSYPIPDLQDEQC